jgi:hypothetical protein
MFTYSFVELSKLEIVDMVEMYPVLTLKRKQLCYCLCAHGKNFGRLLFQENISLEYSKLSDSRSEEP